MLTACSPCPTRRSWVAAMPGCKCRDAQGQAVPRAAGKLRRALGRCVAMRGVAGGGRVERAATYRHLHGAHLFIVLPLFLQIQEIEHEVSARLLCGRWFVCRSS